ncbi:hypothetical protein B6U80_02545 [Candidatus Pacearchaeota archaeon ex4484_26]|nr:MAG: hypothetical protein B6U80_02545 [Candidatus Pacearchaeota archaeon ex4484_26]
MGLESLDWQKISMDEWEEAKKNVIHQVQQVGYISSYDWDGIKKEWKSRRRGWVQKKQKEEKQLQEFNRLHSLERRSKKPFVKFLSSIYKIVAPQKSKKIGVEYLTWKRDVAGKARDFYQYLYEGLEKGLEEQEVKREILKQS